MTWTALVTKELASRLQGKLSYIELTLMVVTFTGLVLGWVLRPVAIDVRGSAPTVGWLPVLTLFLVAAILAGVGSLDRYHFHVVKTTNMPPGNTFMRGEGPFDILTVTGMVIGGNVHAHVTFSNTEVAMGGHLEEGCRVLTFAVIVLAVTDDADFTGWDVPGPL